MKKLRTLIGLLFAALVFRWFSCGPADEGPRGPKLTNRVWVDKVADGPRDPVLRLLLLDKGKQRRGIIAQTTKFRVVADRIRYKLKGRELTIVIPQDEQKASFKTKTWRCDDGPRGYDLCLELRSGSRRLRLYSKRKKNLEAEEWGPWLGEENTDEGIAPAASVGTMDWFEARAQP